MIIRPHHAVDFYKTGHKDQYPAKTQAVYGNFTPRSDAIAFKIGCVLPDFDHKVVNFGLQGVIKTLLVDLWNAAFFQRPREIVVAEYQRRMDRSLGEGAVKPDAIGALHDLGYLPILIRALPEGARVNIKVPLYTITNTHTDFAWLVNYLETQLSNELWKPITVATIAFEYRRLLEKYALETGSPMEFVDWQGHDFSYRGLSGIYDCKSVAGHLLSFLGTDTVTAIDYLEDYYNAREDFIGGSVPANEHSVASTNILNIEAHIIETGGYDGVRTEEVAKLLSL